MCAIAQNPAGLQKQAQTPRDPLSISLVSAQWDLCCCGYLLSICIHQPSTQHPLGSSSECASGWTDRPDTTDSHISKSETTFPISKLNPTKCWTGFLQLFSSQQMYFPYFHYLGATVYLSSCKRISKSWRNSSGWTRGKKSLLHQLDWKPYLSSSVKSCCLLNHCMNFWSGVMQ